MYISPERRTGPSFKPVGIVGAEVDVTTVFIYSTHSLQAIRHKVNKIKTSTVNIISIWKKQ